MTRIIAGRAGGITLAVPSSGTRPTSDRVRESLFSALEAAGAITGLEVHPRFELQPAFTDGSGKRWTAITYEADFSYTEDGARVIEDVKGCETAVFRLKRKLFLQRYPALRLRVVRASR